MRLVRGLFLFTAKTNINILLMHIPGNINYLAASLSRLQVAKFLQAHYIPIPHRPSHRPVFRSFIE